MKHFSLLKFMRTALMLAACNNKPVIRVLLQGGVDVNQQSGVDVHLSTTYNCTYDIRILLQHSASTTIKNERGQTPIDGARKENNKEVVLLLQH